MPTSAALVIVGVMAGVLGGFAGDAELRGVGGDTVVKSFVLLLESVKPPFFRRMEVVLLPEGAPPAAALPSKALAEPKPTKSTTVAPPMGLLPLNAV